MGLRIGIGGMATLLLAIAMGWRNPPDPAPPGPVGIQTVSVPMRDGVSLATDLYLPSDGSTAHPVVLVRTPYNKTWMEGYGRYFSQGGYAVAIQDVRGRWASGGDWEPFIHEGTDGYDSVEWIAKQEWSNGKVGMVGGSYSGSVQFAAAIQHPPHLVTIVPTVTPAMPFDNLPYENGVFLMGWAVRWTDIVENARTGRELQGKLERSITDDWSEALAPLPVGDLAQRVVGREVPYFRDWIGHPQDDEYWEPVRYLEALESLEIPVFLQSGWFDGGNRGTRLAFERLLAGGNDRVRLLMGPWVHSDRGTRQVNGIDMGPAAERDLMAEYRRWLDRWLKDEANGIEEEDPVHLYLMGSDRWLTGENFPLDGTRFRTLYLGGPGSGSGAGRLTWDPPSGAPSFDAFTYDPSDPTPSFYAHLKRGAMDAYKAALQDRDDILIYETDPLTEPLNLVGPVSLTLYASSSAVDTDWVGTLYAVADDGAVNVLGLTFGVLRARFRESRTSPSLLEPGRVYPFTLDLSHTAVTVPVGNRLRLEVASAAFPEYSRNLNTGGHNEAETSYVEARQRIYRTSEWPSHLLLPVVDLGGNR